jgi:hypothetical protein
MHQVEGGSILCSASKRGLPSQFDQSSSRSVAKQKESLNLKIVVVVVPLKFSFGNFLQGFLLAEI